MSSKTLKVGGPADAITVQLTIGEGEARAWDVAKPVRSLKRRLRDLDAEVNAIGETAREAATAKFRETVEDPEAQPTPGQLGALIELSDEQEDRIMELQCLQISELTVPRGEHQLGELLLDQWKGDEIVDEEIIGLLRDLQRSLGKPSAS